MNSMPNGNYAAIYICFGVPITAGIAVGNVWMLSSSSIESQLLGITTMFLLLILNSLAIWGILRKRISLSKVFVLLVLAVSLVVLGCVLLDISRDQSHRINILSPTKTYENWKEIENSNGEVLPGEELQVRRIRYKKDRAVIKVRRENGVEAWVNLGEQVELSKKESDKR